MSQSFTTTPGAANPGVTATTSATGPSTPTTTTGTPVAFAGTPATAPVKSCNNSSPQFGVAGAAGSSTCTITTTSSMASGGTIVDTVSGPAGVSATCGAAVAGFTCAQTTTTSVTFTCAPVAPATTCPAGSTAGSVVITATGPGTVTENMTVTNAAGGGTTTFTAVMPAGGPVTFVAPPAPTAATQPAKACAPTAPVGGNPGAIGTTTCTLTSTSPMPAGGTVVDTVTSPAGATITACTATGGPAAGAFACGAVPGGSATTVVFTCGAGGCAAGIVIGTVTISAPAGTTGTVTETLVVTNAAGGGTTTFAGVTGGAAFVLGAPTAINDKVGCINSTDPAALAFTTDGTGLATANFLPTAAGLSVVNFTTGIGTSALASGGGVTGALGGPFPFVSALECASVIQDVGGGPDGILSTVPGGVVSYTLSSTNGVAVFTEGGTSVRINCGSDSGAGALESCQGSQFTNPTTGATVAGTVFPNPALVVHVALAPGTTFSLIGGGSPVITLTDTYTEFPSLGTLTASASLVVPVLTPTYSLSLTPNPSSIPATGAPGTGSTITATVFHFVTFGCVPVSGSTIFVVCSSAGGLTPGGTPGIPAVGQPVAINFLLQLGAEPGIVTMSTNLGFFAGTTVTGGLSVSGSATSFAGQTVSLQCGAAPATNPVILIPTTGLFPSFSFTSCTSVSAVLLGGGSVGTATIIGNFIGEFTGATAQASTTVAITPTPANATLSRGCNEVVINAGAGLTAAQVLALASPTSNVVSIWQFNNSLHAFQALFFNVSGAPTDISGVGAGSQSVFYCVSGTTTVTTGF